MTLTELTAKTVGELAVEMPISIRVFENWKIDYCCGGKTPLTDACEAAGRSVDEFAAELSRATAVPELASRSWAEASLARVASDIVSIYHAYTREELETIVPLAEKVFNVHGGRRAELAEVNDLVRALTGDMLPHMLKEEQVLFPYVTQMEEAAAGRREAVTPFFGTVKNPVRAMMVEHDRVGEVLARLRAISDGYMPPESACFSYRELYRRLAEFEQRTHEHVHIENNLYFPRAVALEEQAGRPAAFAHGCGSGSACQH